MLAVTVGDVILIPPGVVHFQLDTSDHDFEVAGTYPVDFPEVAELRGPAPPEVLATIKNVPMISSDPIFGVSGAPWTTPNVLIALPSSPL